MESDSRTLRSLLEKPSRPQVDAGIRNDIDQEADYSAYAQGRISRHPQLTLVIRQADGSARAFSYAYFYGAETDGPALGFTLQFAQHQVRVQGRNLQILFRLIVSIAWRRYGLQVGGKCSRLAKKIRSWKRRRL